MRGPWIRCFLLIVIGIFATGTLFAQEKQWLQYGVARELGEKVGWENVCHFSVPIEKTLPKEVKAGKFVASDPIFAKWSTPMAKSGLVWMVFDRSKPKGSYDRVVVDSNCDGDLTNETAYKPFEVQEYDKNYYRAVFAPVKVVFSTQDGPVTYHFQVQFHLSSNRSSVNLGSACYYEGQVMIGGKSHQCALVDANANGTFNDSADDFGQIDRILIDKGKIWDARFNGRYIEVDGKFYHPEPSQDGAFVAFTSCENIVLGEVRVPEGLTKVRVGGLNGLLDLRHTKGVGKLPVGKYRVYDWEIERKDEAGVPWKLAGRSFPNSVLLEVTKEKAATLDVGEPVVSSLAMNPEGGQYSFNQGLQGKLGERIDVECNGTRPAAPKIRIKNKAGTFDQTYSLEYG